MIGLKLIKFNDQREICFETLSTMCGLPAVLHQRKSYWFFEGIIILSSSFMANCQVHGHKMIILMILLHKLNFFNWITMNGGFFFPDQNALETNFLELEIKQCLWQLLDFITSWVSSSYAHFLLTFSSQVLLVMHPFLSMPCLELCWYCSRDLFSIVLVKQNIKTLSTPA